MGRQDGLAENDGAHSKHEVDGTGHEERAQEHLEDEDGVAEAGERKAAAGIGPPRPPSTKQKVSAGPALGLRSRGLDRIHTEHVDQAECAENDFDVGSRLADDFVRLAVKSKIDPVIERAKGEGPKRAQPGAGADDQRAQPEGGKERHAEGMPQMKMLRTKTAGGQQNWR